MDGQGWHVDVEVLEEAARGIVRSVDGQESFELRGLCGDAELYGHGGVHSALMEFCVRFSDSLDALTTDATEISDTLSAAAKAYRATDEAAARSLADPAVKAVES